MGRVRRYQTLAVLCALLATAVAPSTARAAYAEVDRPPAQSVTIAARDTKPAPRRVEAARPAVAAILRPIILPQTPKARPSKPLYVLYCSLLR